MIRTARRELSGWDSDGSGGTSGCDSDGLGGNFLVVIRTGGGLSGCDSDGSGGCDSDGLGRLNFLVVIWGKLSGCDSDDLDGSGGTFWLQTLKLVFSDQAPELKNAVTTLGALHRLFTPGMPKTNGLIENKVRLVLHGARVLLRQAGFEPRWWPFAVRHFSMARNIENRGEGSPCIRRHGEGNFSGVILPFGCLADFYSQNEKKRPLLERSNEGRDHWIANEDEKVLTRVHVEARTKLFIPIGTSCPVKIKGDLGRRRSTVLNYLDGSTDFVVDENWLQAGNHEWTGETHFDCDFDQIDEDEAEIYENKEYEPECNDEPDFVPIDEVEVEETSVTTALPAEKKERDFIKIEEDPKFVPSLSQAYF